MLPLTLYTPSEVAHQLGERVAQLRLARNWKRETLAQRAGVSVFLIKRFESSGQVVGHLALHRGQVLFELAPDFITGSRSISPFKLAMQPGLQLAPHALRGLHGVFDDSLPDVPRAQVRETSMRLAEVEAAGELPRTRPPARRARP